MNNNDKKNRKPGWYTIHEEFAIGDEVNVVFWSGTAWLSSSGQDLPRVFQDRIEMICEVGSRMTPADTPAIDIEDVQNRLFVEMNRFATGEPDVEESLIAEIMHHLKRWGFITDSIDPAYNPGNVYQEFQNGWYRVENRETEETFSLRYVDGVWIDSDGNPFSETDTIDTTKEDDTFLHVLTGNDPREINGSDEDVQ